MNGYSRIRQSSKTRSKSIDFCDLSSLPEPIQNSSSSSKPLESKQDQKKILEKGNINDVHGSIQEHENEESIGEIFGVILSRKSSVSSASSHKFMSDEKKSISPQSSSLHSSVMRALSMKRSTSVSEGYCRIHHQCDPTADDQSVMLTTLQKRSMKKRGKIFRACKRILGF